MGTCREAYHELKARGAQLLLVESTIDRGTVGLMGR